MVFVYLNFFPFYERNFFCSATMDTPCVLPVKQGYTTGVPLVDRSLEILGV